MAKDKPKKTRLSFDKESIDPAISHMFFYSVCNGDRKLAGKLVNKFMWKSCQKHFGAGTETILGAIQRDLEK